MSSTITGFQHGYGDVFLRFFLYVIFDTMENVGIKTFIIICI